MRTWRGRIMLGVISLGVLMILVATACAQVLTSNDLINHARAYDGKVVSYQGEVVGEVMVRGAYAWINVSDSLNALGVWVPKELVGIIQTTGNYRHKGDGVEVAGIFNRACRQHGGDLDIHAIDVRIIQQGQSVARNVNEKKKLAIAVLTGVLIILWILKRFIKR